MKKLSQLKIPPLSFNKIAIVALLISGLTACYEMGSDSKDSLERKVGVQLKENATEEEFKQYLTANFTQRIDPSIETRAEITESIAVPSESNTDVSESDNSTSNFSGTNNQVMGVDEGDIWKYDGENFFVLKPAIWNFHYDEPIDCNPIEPEPGQVVVTVCSQPKPTQASPAKLRIVKNTQENISTLDIDNIDPDELYLNDQSLVVLGNRSNYQNNWDDYDNWQDGQNTMTIIDIQDKTRPSITFSLALDGYLVQSRRIGDEIFIISRYSPNISGLIYSPQTDAEVTANKLIINNLSLHDLMPKITINDQQHDLIADNTCLIPDVSDPAMGSPSLTMITRIDINSAEFSSRCMAGEVEGIYMSEDNLYTFNTSYWNFSDNSNKLLHWTSGNTHLHKFDLASFNYLGSALLEGQLASANPRLRLGELTDGSIAVVTSKRSGDGDWRLTDHKLTVLNNQDGELKQFASLPNENQPAAIGKVNEQIYSVRFMQDRAYIVTFEKVDPLYVIDLSNPSQPSIAGELEIPGYSDYLHPIGNDLLLGIGKDAILGSSGTSWYQGVKVSLFDVKDIQQPTELGSIIIGKRGSSTALEYDLHSFTGIQRGDQQDGQYRFAFPISVSDGPTQGDYWQDPESQFFQWSHSGLYLFEVKDKQLTQAGALITDRSSDTNVENNYWSSNHSRRGLIQADDVYHLSGDDLYKANWNSPEQMSEKF
jgi:uncharacterized secreted protein with C-terminal beta-propeller domain